MRVHIQFFVRSMGPRVPVKKMFLNSMSGELSIGGDASEEEKLDSIVLFDEDDEEDRKRGMINGDDDLTSKQVAKLASTYNNHV